MKTRILSLFVALLATTALWAYDFSYNGLRYSTTSSNTVQVIYRSEKYPYNIMFANIPETVTYNGTTYSVTSIGKNAFNGCPMLAVVTIPNSVKSIGSGAFYKCPELDSVSMPANSVTYIGAYAFSECGRLTSIEFSDNIKSIGDYAFSGCRGLTSISIPNSVTNIGEGVFSYCTGLTSVSMGNNVTSIGKEAFYSCKSLTSVTIPNSVTSIGESAFSYCTGLTSVDMDNNVTSIGNSAFSACWSLISITIPNSVTSIGERVFWNCIRLTSIVVESGNMNYDSRENCNAVIETASKKLICGCKTTIIPNNVTSIGDYAFDGCTSLTSITIPNSVTSIGDYAFEDCTGITSIIIPDSVSKMGTLVFSKCKNLTSVMWNAIKCGGWVGRTNAPFYNIASQITSFIFGDRVDSIPDNLCYGMSKLNSIIIPTSTRCIGKATFNGCTNIDSVIWNATKCTNYTFDSIAPQIKNFIFGNEVECIPAHLCSNMVNLSSIGMPESTISIGDSAFKGCSGLSTITIPTNVTSIGNKVFDGCTGLASIVWNAKKCGGWTNNGKKSPFFAVAPQIKSFTFGSEVDSIPAYLCYGMSNIPEITILDNATSIGDSVFYGCSKLTTISIPSTMEYIGRDALGNNNV